MYKRLTQYRRVTDGRTDRTSCHGIVRTTHIRGKKWTSVFI